MNGSKCFLARGRGTGSLWSQQMPLLINSWAIAEGLLSCIQSSGWLDTVLTRLLGRPDLCRQALPFSGAFSSDGWSVSTSSLPIQTPLHCCAHSGLLSPLITPEWLLPESTVIPLSSSYSGCSRGGSMTPRVGCDQRGVLLCFSFPGFLY